MYKSKLFRTIALLAFLMVSSTAFAQSVEVTGTVTDAGEPMIGATVMVKGSQNAVITDLDGKYAIKAKTGDVLVFSFIGYLDEERTVSSNTIINVAMSADVATLEQVVVLGYGAQTKKKDLSASVGIVAAPEQLAKTPVTSTTAMLQGQIPGVVVTNDGGSASGGSPSMVIRGQGSKNGDSVLWVVDGVPGGPINNLSDIESIVVLKDAASAAIYGAQSGAGGVVIVTTKAAQKGVSVSYDGLVGVRSATNVLTPLNAEQQLEMTQLAYANAGQSLPDGWDVNKNPWIKTTRTNWMDEIFRDALYQRHNVIFNGGTDKFKNRVSFSLENSDGVLTGTYAKNMGIQYKGEFQANKWLKFTENFRWGTSEDRGANTSGATGGVITRALSMPSSASVTPASYDPLTGEYSYAADGYGGVAIEDQNYIDAYGNYTGIHGIVQNPLRGLTSATTRNQNMSLYTSTALELGNFDNFKGFKFISRFTYSASQGLYKEFNPKILEAGSPDYTNDMYYTSSRSNSWKTENTITYDRTFGKHSVGALLSTTADHSWGWGFKASASNFTYEEPDLQYFRFADSKSYSVEDSYSGDDANLAFIARLSYSYDDRYFVTASWRRDYAGRLPDENNYGDFPAVTGAWKISSEPWFGKHDGVSFLKIRASWGRVGNLSSIGSNYKSTTLGVNSSNKVAYYGWDAGYTKIGTMVDNLTAKNNNLTWETSQQTNIGLDAGFFNDRLSFSADLYDKRTFNLIQSQTMNWPSTIGASAKTINLGEISNRGIELTLGWADKVGDWSYYINANAAYNKNRVESVGVLDEDGNSGVWAWDDQWRDVRFYNYSREGGALREYYLIVCDGIFQSWEDVYEHSKDGKLIQPNAQPGDLRFVDYNGDGKIDNGDRQYLGNNVPDWTYNCNLGFTWKELSFSAQIYGVQGAQAAHVSKMAEVSMSSKVHNRSTAIYNAWSETNTHTNIPRVSKSDDNSNFMTASSWYLEDSSFCRLKNVTISYDFSKLLRKVNHFGKRGSSCSLYVSGENLFTITKYTGMDPECGEYDFLKYPVSRVLSVGLKLTY